MITTSTGQTTIAMQSAAPPQPPAPQNTVAVGPTLTMVPSSRMAGEIAVWTSGAQAQNAVADSQARSVQTADENRTFNTTTVATTSGTHAYSFHDMLEMLNPLQHIPVINQIYRRLTGDTINPAAQVLGDAIYGGPLGGAISLANVIVTQATGHDLPGTMLALVRGKNLDTPAAAPAPDALPPAVLRYADNGVAGQRLVYERVAASSDRMAGSMINVRAEKGSAADGMLALAKAATNQVATIMPAAGIAAGNAPRQSAFRSLHLNA